MPTPEYTQENLLKKVHIGETDYYFKDEDLRNFVESFGDAVYKDTASEITEEGTDIPTEAAVAAYLDDVKTNEIDPKIAVSLGNDEELIFNYTPITPTPEDTIAITIAGIMGFGPGEMSTEDYLDYIEVAVDEEFPKVVNITPGTTIGNIQINYHRTDPEPAMPFIGYDFTIYPTGNGFDNLLDENFVPTEDMTVYVSIYGWGD